MNISVIGLGYVGLANTLLLSRSENVTSYDTNVNKINLLKEGISPIDDDLIIENLKVNRNVKFTSNFDEAIRGKDFIIISTPTDYNEHDKSFDTSSVEDTIEAALQIEQNSTFIIKSTIPVGFTQHLKEFYNFKNIIFVPEFLREGKALYDNLHPSRIIVGENTQRGKIIADIFKKNAIDNDIKVLLTDSTEAEAIKLFSNTFLALRVAYFNELDTFAEIRNLNSKQIIDGVSLDPRIGGHYNNPSFGYGGYCLPKDTKQLLANYENVPSNIMKAVVDANSTRKSFIANQIIRKNPKIVGIYRLTMKSNSDNFRYSSIQGIIKRLLKNNIEIIIYEPNLELEEFLGCKVINNLNVFKERATIIVANRIDRDLKEVYNKVYTRDLFERD